jgi:hypothetical protein
MAYSQLPTRSTGNTIPAADVNQLQLNIEALKGGAGAAAPTTDIESLETDKINFTDIINDLTTGGAAKVLSAEQGKTLQNNKASTADLFSVFASNDRNRNAIINGNFDIWQRGTSSTTNAYLADQWLNVSLTNTTHTVSQQSFTNGQTDVPNNPKHYLQSIVVAGTANALNLSLIGQRIEDVRTFAGENITLQFWAKATEAGKFLSTEFFQEFGTGGSSPAPSDAVVEIGITKHTLTTSWQKFVVNVTMPSITGKTIGTDVNSSCFGFQFWFSAGSTYAPRTDTLGEQSGTFHIANVQLCLGTYAELPEHRRQYADEFALCQRYYETSCNWRDGYFFGTNGLTVEQVGFCYGKPINVNSVLLTPSWNFHTHKRKKPTTNIMAPFENSPINKVRRDVDGVIFDNIYVLSDSITRSGFAIIQNADGDYDTSNFVQFGWEADASY